MDALLPLGVSCLPVSRGVVRWFDFEAGARVIASNSSDGEVFFDFTAIPAEGYCTLKPGTSVGIEAVERKAGLTARYVRKEDV
jgi:cold shock CspA family protein